MSFLTAASERSSSGSGMSGASEVSFSGASSFSFSFCAALVLLAMHPPGHAPAKRQSTLPYPMGRESNDRKGVVPGGRRPPMHPPRIGEFYRSRLSPGLTLHAAPDQGLIPRFREPSRPLRNVLSPFFSQRWGPDSE